MDLRLTFDEVPELYDRMRPTYVSELFSDIFSYSKLNKDSRVLEIGIGTGQATLPFLEAGCDVTAIELGSELAEYSIDKYKKYTNLKVINVDFMDYECLENCFDVIYSATAFHWIPEQDGYKKVYNLLKSGGTFARFRNHPYRDKDNELLSEAIENLYKEFFPNANKGNPIEYNVEDAATLSNLSIKYGFNDAEYKMYKRIRTLSSDEYIGLLHTYSDHRALGKDALSKFSDKIADAIYANGEKINIYDTIDLQLARKP